MFVLKRNYEYKNTSFDADADFKIRIEFCNFETLIEILKEIVEHLANFDANAHWTAKKTKQITSGAGI